MRRLKSVARIAILVATICEGGFAAQVGSAVSPDGRNEIRLFDDPVLS